MNTKNISNITKFLDNDNIKILWDVIIDEEIIKSFALAGLNTTMNTFNGK